MSQSTLEYIRACNDANQLARFGSPIPTPLRLELEALQVNEQVLLVKYTGRGFGYVVYKHPFITTLIHIIAHNYFHKYQHTHRAMIAALLSASADPGQHVPSTDHDTRPECCSASRATIVRYIMANPLCTRKQVVAGTGIVQHVVGDVVRKLIRDNVVKTTKIAGVAAEVLQHIP